MKTVRVGRLDRVRCCYCKRELSPPDSGFSTALTFDHVRAKSQGGVKTVPCCVKCNLLKDNLSVDDWNWFTATHPRWWKEFTVPSQVHRIVREFRFAQVRARGAELQRRIARIQRRNGFA